MERKEAGEKKKMHQVHLVTREYDIIQLKAHYRFTEEDAKRLKHMQKHIHALLPSLLDGFYDYIFSFEHAKLFLHDKMIQNRHRSAINNWFLDLFGGVYDDAYFRKLQNISETHVRIGLPSHYVNCAFSYIREFLDKEFHKGNEEDIYAMNKIIDINLDILSLTYQEEEQQHFIEQVLLLKQSILNQTIIPYVQPIVDTKSGRTIKFECLMRIQDQQNYTIHSIYPLLKVARSIRLYADIVKIMITHTMEIFHDLPWTFSINVGYEDIADPDLLDFLYKKLETFPQPQRVIFEILESDFIEDFNIVSSFVNKIRTYGCKIAIDDFGSGYSNIENILELSPDYLKIDGSLIKDIDSSSVSLTIVQNVVKLAKDLKIKTIAEYVHNEEVCRIVKSLRIDYMQGFYTGEPFPAQELLIKEKKQ